MLHQSSYPSEYPEREARRVGLHSPTLPGWLARTGGKSRLGSFFMYIIFFLEIKSSWINLEFSVENVVENVVIQRKCVWIEYFTLVFDRKSKIYP